MDERLQFVARRLAGEAMVELCRELGISRKSGLGLILQLDPGTGFTQLAGACIHLKYPEAEPRV